MDLFMMLIMVMGALLFLALCIGRLLGNKLFAAHMNAIIAKMETETQAIKAQASRIREQIQHIHNLRQAQYSAAIKRIEAKILNQMKTP